MPTLWTSDRNEKLLILVINSLGKVDVKRLEADWKTMFPSETFKPTARALQEQFLKLKQRTVKKTNAELEIQESPRKRTKSSNTSSEKQSGAKQTASSKKRAGDDDSSEDDDCEALGFKTEGMRKNVSVKSEFEYDDPDELY